MSNVRIGLLGCGAIGGFLARYIVAEGAASSMELSYAFDVDEKRLQDIPAGCRVTEQSVLFKQSADLVVAAAVCVLRELRPVRMGIPLLL